MATKGKAGEQLALLTYKGEDVGQVAVRIKKAGDGLGDGLQVAPVEYDVDDEVYYVLKAKVAHIDHGRDRKTKQLVRTYIMDTTDITATDESTVGEILLSAALRLEKARADAVGQGALDDPNVT